MSEMRPTIRVEAFVRTTPAQVFEAFASPARLTAFWLAAASGPLSAGARVHWEFLVPGAADDLECTVFDPPRRLAVRSSDGSTIAWELEEQNVNGVAGTVVRVAQTELPGSLDEQLAMALEGTQGWTLVLADMKLLLEQGKAMGLVRDKALLIAAAMKKP